MTKPKDHLYIIFGWDGETETEYSVDFVDQPGGPLWTAANLLSDDSTVLDRRGFQRRWPGHNGSVPDGWDQYSDGFAVSVDRVREFAAANRLELVEMPA